MKTLRVARNLLAIGLLCLFMTASGQTVFADMDGFCSGWVSGYACSCGPEGDWSWAGACNFENEENPLELQDAFCEGSSWECNDDCWSWDYREWLASQDPECVWDPFMNKCDPECWFGFVSDYSCTPGTNSSFSCSCSGYMYCEPE